MAAARSSRADWYKPDRPMIRAAVTVRPRAVRPYLDQFTLGESFGHRLLERMRTRFLGEHRSLLDPFAGAGSSLWSSRSWGMEALGVEQLPYAHFCHRSAAQACDVDVDEVALLGQWLIRDGVADPFLDIDSLPLALIDRVGPAHASCALSYREAIEAVPSGPEKDLALFVLMRALRALRRGTGPGRRSRRGAMTLKDRKGNYHASFEDVYLETLYQCLDSITDAARDGALIDMTGTKLLFGSAPRLVPELRDDAFDLVITSPPYLNGFDYLEEYAVEHWCLGLEPEEVVEIARGMLPTRVDPRDADKDIDGLGGTVPGLGVPATARIYFHGLSELIQGMHQKLQDEAEVLLVVDDLRWKGRDIPVAKVLSAMAERSGYRVVAIYHDPDEGTMGLGRERALTKVCHWTKA